MIKELIFKYVTSRKLNKVYHRGCGGHVGYVSDISKPKNEAKNFYFIDGYHQQKQDKILIPCNKCGKTITNLGNLTLDNFDTLT